MIPLVIFQIIICILLNATNGVVIKVGHLLPQKLQVQHEPEVLKLCVKDLEKRQILPKNISFE